MVPPMTGIFSGALLGYGATHPSVQLVPVTLAVLAAGGMDDAASTRTRLQVSAAEDIGRAGERLAGLVAAGEPHSATGEALSPAAERSAARSVESSMILRECQSAAPVDARLAVAVLGLIESEPSLVRAGTVRLFEAAEAVRSAVWPPRSSSPMAPRGAPAGPARKAVSPARNSPVPDKRKIPVESAGSEANRRADEANESPPLYDQVMAEAAGRRERRG